jgi:hypothetical protein
MLKTVEKIFTTDGCEGISMKTVKKCRLKRLQNGMLCESGESSDGRKDTSLTDTKALYLAS